MTQPSEPVETPTLLTNELAGAIEVVVEPGDAFDTYPYTEQPELLVIRDADAVQQLVRELATADLTPGVVLPALSGLTLTFRDEDGGFLGHVGVLTPRWLRQWWSNDALLPEPLSLFREDSSELHQYLRSGWAADDKVTPAHAAAEDAAGVEHALGDDGTLCGLPAASIEVYRHLFRFRSGNCPDCYRIAWANNTAPLWPARSHDAATLSAGWAARWGSTPPVGHLLQGADIWVRFHSLPESQRYAENAAEYDELLHRHHSILRDLADTTSSNEVLVFTHSWSVGRLPVPQSAPLQAAVPGSEYWMSFLQDPTDPENTTWHHAWVNRMPATPEALDPLLRLVADDGTAGVIICDEHLTWCYHPYDGGGDVLPATAELRDELKDRYREWLPSTESGV